MESIPGSHKHLKIWAQEVQEGGGEKGGWGDDLLPQISGPDVSPYVSKRLQVTHFLDYLGWWAGCIYSSNSIERSRQFLENFSARSSWSFCEIEIPRRVRGKTLIRKKKLVEAEASPSIHVSIHRSLLPPTALPTICIYTTS